VAEPDGRAVPLPNARSLTEFDLKALRFDVGLRGYRMAQVDRALRRTAYDLGYKDEMIAVLEAEVAALREGRAEDAELLRTARESASGPEPVGPADATTAGADPATVTGPVTDPVTEIATDSATETETETETEPLTGAGRGGADHGETDSGDGDGGDGDSRADDGGSGVSQRGEAQPTPNGRARAEASERPSRA
jgi:DivIVA domain-containing protein